VRCLCAQGRAVAIVVYRLAWCGCAAFRSDATNADGIGFLSQHVLGCAVEGRVVVLGGCLGGFAAGHRGVVRRPCALRLRVAGLCAAEGERSSRGCVGFGGS